MLEDNQNILPYANSLLETYTDENQHDKVDREIL